MSSPDIDLSKIDPIAYIKQLFINGDATAIQELRDGDYTDDQIKTALEGVAEDPDAAADGYDAAGDDIDAKLDYIQGLIDNNQINNNVDQSQHVDAYEVHGDVVSDNDSNVANATGEGSIAGDEVYGNQVQTGDGQQVGGDSGVQNQGDNSGQQAGGSATADNVTSGDNNTVGSDEASGIGDGHTSLDGVSVNDSSLAFGSGSATAQADDTENFTSNESYDEHTSDSYNTELSDDDSQYQETSINAGHEGYEEPVYEDDYKGDDYHEHDAYDEHDDDGGNYVEQDAHIIDAG